ncbi:MAG: hypothetical protein ABI861_03160, partial [Panacibacter sp.]
MKCIFCLVFITLIMSSCGSDKAKTEEQIYTEQKESLQDKEKKNPLKFLSVTGDNKKNIIGQTVVRGTIHNKATLVAFKDVRVKMLCYKNNKMAEEHEDVINEIIKPNTDKDFKTKYR